MYWYPVTSAYAQFLYPSISFLKRLTSKNLFNEIKDILSIESVEHIKHLSLKNCMTSQIPALANLLPTEINVY